MIVNQIIEIRRIMAETRDSALSYPAESILLAASKTQNAEAIGAAIVAGITDFGENRVQEAQDKWPEIKAQNPDIRLHFIGALQSNKAEEAVALFDVIQSVDRIKLVDSLVKAMAEQGKQVPCYIQVNTGEEVQKAGVLPSELADFVGYCRERALPVEGLMCVPPVGQHPGPHFALLRKLAHGQGLEKLSMGMSDDYVDALRMGSSCIRLGRLLFGERQA